MQDNVERARAHFLDGVARFERGELATAEASFQASLGLLPGRASTLLNLAAVQAADGRGVVALATLDQALQAEPGNALAWLKRAQLLRALDRHDEALPALERATVLQPTLAEAWTQLGQLWRDRGEREAAIAAFRTAIAHGADELLHRYFLAALGADEAPPQAPTAYVQALFDEYAADFEQHLQSLGYRAHELLLARAQALRAGGFERMLDLGCGSGLCGRAAQGRVHAVDGVDLSAAMLSQARASGVYDELVQADVAEHLQQTPRRYDLVVAADVLIYVGAPDAVFAGVRRVLAPGGLFCLTVESSDGPEDLVLRPSLRYAHSERSLRSLAESNGLEVAALERGTLRHERDGPVSGLYVWLRSPPATLNAWRVRSSASS
jgi:predicted TPR repeat methyltransferase